jgi:signal recognition particle receptor subunit beta
MSLVNYATREITCKIVYYGPGRSGKTTNLQYIHSRVPWDRKGEMVSLATEADRTLFFDFLPLELGQISGFTTRFQLYTVPGQVYYNATRKLVLQGADGVVFVADSQKNQIESDMESFRNLHENLLEHGIDIRDIPVVIQYNKRDLPNVFSIEQLEEDLNFRNVPSYPASALLGEGVFDTLRSVSEGVLKKLAGKLESPVSLHEEEGSGGRRR